MTVGDFLFPNYTCILCNAELNAPQNLHICDKCAAALKLNTKPMTFANTDEVQYFTHAFAPFKYGEGVKNLVMELKYNANSFAAAALAPYMAAVWLKNGGHTDAILIPVPLSRERFRQREYNQAALLAHEISQYVKMPVDENVLIRTKATEIQKNKDIKERTENLRDAFAVTNKDAVKGKKFVIIDDVFTTGATVNECAKTLKKADAAQIDVLAASRIDHDD
jgi:ComF family protein